MNSNRLDVIPGQNDTFYRTKIIITQEIFKSWSLDCDICSVVVGYRRFRGPCWRWRQDWPL